MSTRVTWYSTGPFTHLEVVRTGQDMPDGQRVTAPCAVVLSGDDVTVLEGDRATLMAMLQGAYRALAGQPEPVHVPGQLPLLPTQADEHRAHSAAAAHEASGGQYGQPL